MTTRNGVSNLKIMVMVRAWALDFTQGVASSLRSASALRGFSSSNDLRSRLSWRKAQISGVELVFKLRGPSHFTPWSPRTSSSIHTTSGNTMSDSPYAFDAPDADLIVRAPFQSGSEEFKDFHVHKTILSVASAVFRDMFSIPQPLQPPESGTTLPIVQITEFAEVFETFLRLVYPIEPPVIASLQLLDSLFRIAEKYMARGIHARLKPILLSPSFLKDDPILVYAIAHRMDLEEEVKLTIPHTFNTDLIRGIPRDKLGTMTIEAYHSLLVEHSLRRDKIIDAVDEVYRSWGKPLGSCRCAEQLKREIRLQTLGRPFLGGETLEKLFSFVPETKCNTACLLSLLGKRGFFSDLMGRM